MSFNPRCSHSGKVRRHDIIRCITPTSIFRLDVVSKVLKLAEKERIRVLIWALEKLREDEVLIKRVHQAGIVRKILYETDWCKKSEEKLSLDFKPQLLIDCLSVIDSSLPSDISLVLIKLCKVWVLVRYIRL